MKALFLLSSEDAAALVFLRLRPVVALFLYLFSGSEEGCLGFEAGHICGVGGRQGVGVGSVM